MYNREDAITESVDRMAIWIRTLCRACSLECPPLERGNQLTALWTDPEMLSA